MDIDQFIQYLLESEEYAPCITHLEIAEPRRPVHTAVAEPANELVCALLERAGISRLFGHQAAALDTARQGKDQVIVTGTASGKTLCYNLAVLEHILGDSEIRALYLFPTKALAQDQLRALSGLLDRLPSGVPVPGADTYDGDTPTHRRKRIRTTARLVFSNPDMLHQSILPNHPRWAEFLAHLRFVVLDEMHIYRGVFGSNVANVLRRLDRICRHYDARPQYICTSATIANPLELAKQLTGRTFELIDQDCSPRGKRYFVFWNPPPSRRNPALRRSALSSAQTLLELMLQHGIQSLAFLRTRAQAELLYRYLRDRLEKQQSPLVDKIRPYRGGYLPSERREIERQLFSGELLAVTTTNALELGIDVGHIRASLVVGYPGTVSSIWQQAGRAGRGTGSSMAVFIASNDPEDQYLIRNPTYFLQGGIESAAIDPDNPYILANHLGCAAFELPLKTDDPFRTRGASGDLAAILEQENYLKHLDGRWYWSSPEYPAARTNLRTLSGQNFNIHQADQQPIVIGTVDEASVQILTHPGAIYLHEGETYRVARLDFESHSVEVRKVEVDYFTRPIVQSSLNVKSVRESLRLPNGWSRIGEVETSWSVIGFRKIKFYTQDNLGIEPLTLPTQLMQTVALWLRFEADSQEQDPSARSAWMRGLQGLQNVLSSALPMLVLCDRSDIGSVIQLDQGEVPAIYLFDRYPGGMGFAERGFAQIRELLALAYDIVSSCGCETGCPSCVGVLETAFPGGAEWTQSFPDKVAAFRMLAAATHVR